jgi:hypothetical protein
VVLRGDGQPRAPRCLLQACVNLLKSGCYRFAMADMRRDRSGSMVFFFAQVRLGEVAVPLSSYKIRCYPEDPTRSVKNILRIRSMGFFFV